VPSAIGYLVLGDVIVAALYERGSFTRSDTLIVAVTLGAYSIGLLAATASRLLSSAFFALHDTATPARVAIIRVVLAGIVGGGATVFIRLNRPDWIAYGAIPLAAATGAAAWLEWFMLRRHLARRVGHVPAGRSQIIRMLLAAMGAAVLARMLYVALPAWRPELQAVAVLIPYGTAYFAFAYLLGVEISALGRFKRVLRR
jgi:putative peptidoglycan lipid II flippase